jgi:hypothetical protein
VQLEIGSTEGSKSIRIGFTDQKISPHGGLALMSSFMRRSGLAARLEARLPQHPVSNNSCPPIEHALGFIAGVLAGADKFSRVAQLRDDPALPELLGIKAIPSQPTLTRFFRGFSQGANSLLFNDLFRCSAEKLTSLKGGYTLDLDSTTIIHEEGHQQGVRCGYTSRGIKNSHHPLLAALAEPKLMAGFWLRPGNSHTGNNAENFLRNVLANLPSQVRIGLVRADSGFYSESFLSSLEGLKLKYIVVAQLKTDIKRYIRHEDSAWQPAAVPGIDVCEIHWEDKGWPAQRRLVVIRQKTAQRPQAKGKMLLDLPGYQFQTFVTNLPPEVVALEVWRRYNPRADIENRIKELAYQFGLKSFCCRDFWGTEAACSLAILAYNLVVLFQRQLGLTQRREARTVRWQIFRRAAVFSRAQGRSTLRFNLPRQLRGWWLEVIEKLRSALPSFNCNSVELLSS